MTNPIIGGSFAEVYRILLSRLLHEPENITSPRGEEVNELKDQTLVIKDPTACLYSNERRSSQYKYILAELVWYLTGDNSTEFISKYAKMWDKLKNPDGTVNSSYGYLLFKERFNFDNPCQWTWAYNALATDKDTRQAVLHFNMPKHQFQNNKDFVCTMYGNFLIRDNKLHFTITMRSNDVIRGLPTDIPFFCLLQLNMWQLLKTLVYPDLELGEYTHIVNSIHLYAQHRQLVYEMLGNKFIAEDIWGGAEDLLNTRGQTVSDIERLHKAILADRKLDVPSDSDSAIIDAMYKTIQ